MSLPEIEKEFFSTCDKSFKFLMTKHKMTLEKQGRCCHELFSEYVSPELSIYIFVELLSGPPTVTLIKMKGKKYGKKFPLLKIVSSYFPDDPLNKTFASINRDELNFSLIPRYASFLQKNWEAVCEQIF